MASLREPARAMCGKRKVRVCAMLVALFSLFFSIALIHSHFNQQQPDSLLTGQTETGVTAEQRRELREVARLRSVHQVVDPPESRSGCRKRLAWLLWNNACEIHCSQP